LSLGGAQRSSKHHLSLWERFFARPIRVSVPGHLGHAGSAYY
jgi:hypothetical protein